MAVCPMPNTLRFAWLALSLPLLLAIAGPARAVPALLVEDGRHSVSQGQEFAAPCPEHDCPPSSAWYDLSEPDEPFASWQGSTVTPLLMEGGAEGRAYADDFGTFRDYSVFRIVFDLEDSTDAILSIALQVEGTGDAYVGLRRDGGVIFESRLDFQETSPPSTPRATELVWSPNLLPGRYELLAYANSTELQELDRASVSVSLELADAVPEPGTALLMGLGLAGLSVCGGRGRR